MIVKGKKSSTSNDSGLNFEAQLWAAADKMGGHPSLSPVGVAGFVMANGSRSHADLQ